MSTVSDHDQFRDLMQRYAHGVDDRDLDLVATIFAPGAIFEGVQGEKSATEWLDSMRGQRSFPVSMHVLGEPLATIDGDTAELDTYAVVYQIGDKDKGQADLTLGIRYRDTCARIDGQWLITHRRAATVWMR